MSVPSSDIALVRAFNRDYTRRIGVLREALHGSPYSLTEARVMYEIAHRPGVTAAELALDLDLDRGYLSRILKRFTTQRLLLQAAASEDGRRRHLSLTGDGKRRFADLDRQSEQQAAAMLSGLSVAQRHSLLNGMQSMQRALRGSAAEPAVVYRAHRPGDMGWVVERHGTLYCQEYGWDESFEALVAGIAGDFVRNLDPRRERCWIAERDGRRLGCVFLVAGDAGTAKLRLLLVEPDARGLGVGRHLVTGCVEFARASGYRSVVLWTQECLSAARHLYQQTGFRKVASEAHHSFGHDLVAETWERIFSGA